jgi:ubiquinone/menaquinone biosynthesis C-methylase UbiE
MNERTFRASDAHRLEDPARLEWLPPADVLDRLELAPGMYVADVGARTGYFALPMAALVGQEGKVFAVDLQPEMLEKLKDKLSTPGAPRNIELVQGDATDTKLPDRSSAVVLFASLWHELDDHPAVLTEAARILRDGGRIAILDWRADVDRPPGPPLDERISAEAVARSLEVNGWVVRESVPVGRYCYLVIATRL